ncbi:diacylglycerol/lipid kinase family protein [Natrialbaceae archaeon GCM10025810]|uniref:diacylglycerol/lipid kinase family protein n=1 Tax=Halovalidus salilacus TaxID=3075124 RepID=UPI00362363AB
MSTERDERRETVNDESDDRVGRDRDERRVLVVNPTAGSEDHVAEVTHRGRDHGFEVRETEEAGDAKRFARQAAADADLVAAAGGDGTINQVVNGVVASGELESTTVAVVPAGTGNNFASNVGIEGLGHAFDVIETGERRRLDLGVANDRAFVNSCVGGITAEASGSTSPEEKRRLGVLAYVMSTLEMVRSFEPLSLRVKTAGGPDGDEPDTWEGNAALVLIGNCRRFTGPRRVQANVEDGLFEVTIVEHLPSGLANGGTLERLFGRSTDSSASIVRRLTPSLTIESLGDSPVAYSLDGEILEARHLSVETDPGALTVPVGPGYETPDEQPSALDLA